MFEVSFEEALARKFLWGKSCNVCVFAFSLRFPCRIIRPHGRGPPDARHHERTTKWPTSLRSQTPSSEISSTAPAGPDDVKVVFDTRIPANIVQFLPKHVSSRRPSRPWKTMEAGGTLASVGSPMSVPQLGPKIDIPRALLGGLSGCHLSPR